MGDAFTSLSFLWVPAALLLRNPQNPESGEGKCDTGNLLSSTSTSSSSSSSSAGYSTGTLKTRRTIRAVSDSFSFTSPPAVVSNHIFFLNSFWQPNNCGLVISFRKQTKMVHIHPPLSDWTSRLLPFIKCLLSSAIWNTFAKHFF